VYLLHNSAHVRRTLVHVAPSRPRRTDFALIESDLEAIYVRLARLPTYKEPAKMALLIAFVSAVLGIVGIEAFWRYLPACGSI
jgi:hypothetical protein